MDPKDLDPLYYNPEVIIDTVTHLLRFITLARHKLNNENVKINHKYVDINIFV